VFNSRLPNISPCSPGNRWMTFGTKSEGVGLIVREISFQVFQPMWSWSTNVTDRQMDRRTTCNSKSPLCTIMHRAVIKPNNNKFKKVAVTKYKLTDKLCHYLVKCAHLISDYTSMIESGKRILALTTQASCSHTSLSPSSIIHVQIVTGIEVTIGNCFPEVGEILPDAERRG